MVTRKETEEPKWNRLSTNNGHDIATVALECYAKGIRYNISDDNPEWPPTLWAYCSPSLFGRILSTTVGVRKW